MLHCYWLFIIHTVYETTEYYFSNFLCLHFFLLYLVKKLDSKQVLLKIHYKNKIIDFVFFFFKPVLIKATVGIVVVLANMLSGNPQTWMAANRRILLSASS